MKISEFLINEHPYIDECVEPEKIKRIDFKKFMSLKISSKQTTVFNQRQQDIIKKSFASEKRLEREWKEFLERVFK